MCLLSYRRKNTCLQWGRRKHRCLLPHSRRKHVFSSWQKEIHMSLTWPTEPHKCLPHGRRKHTGLQLGRLKHTWQKVSLLCFTTKLLLQVTDKTKHNLITLLNSPDLIHSHFRRRRPGRRGWQNNRPGCRRPHRRRRRRNFRPLTGSMTAAARCRGCSGG